MKLLVLGGEGMLGHKVFQVLSSRFDTDVTFRSPGGKWKHYPMYQRARPAQLLAGVNALDFGSVVRAFAQAQPDVVINCIGMIKQRKAQDARISISINALFPHQLAELCEATGARLFHMSTDCVFDGRQGNYTEADPPTPEDLYGRSKLLGEIDRPGCLTIRTSIIGRDFMKDIALLEWFLSQRGKQIQGYTRAIYTGFPTQVLAGMMGDLIADHPELSGVYHIASDPLSKYELLVKIKEAMNLPIEIIPTSDFVCDRSLDASRFIAATGYRVPSWDEMVEELANDPTPYDGWKATYAPRQEGV